MDIFIRALRHDDRDQWQMLWKGYQDYYETNLDDVTDSLWQRLMSNDKDGPFCLIAETEDELLGFVQYLFHGTTWSAKQRIYLHDLYTKVYWLTQDFNKEGRRLYDKVSTLTPFIKYMKKV